MTCKYWTNEEISILRDLMDCGASFKQNMHRLPGRTRSAALNKCQELKIKRQTVEMRVLKAMADGRGYTAAEVANAIKATPKHVSEKLIEISKPGDDQAVHVTGSTRERRPVPIYVIGPGENKRAYVPNTHRAPDETDAEIDRRYKSNCDWWPYGDPVVLQSINAMVRVSA